MWVGRHPVLMAVMVCWLLQENPSASLRQIAGQAGVSLSTASDVLKRLSRGESPLPSPGPASRTAHVRRVLSLVSVHNEGDPLEEIIVGTTVGARVPRADRSAFAVEYAGDYDSHRDRDFGHSGAVAGLPVTVGLRRLRLVPGPARGTLPADTGVREPADDVRDDTRRVPHRLPAPR
ncbi:winged helix-turn-helix transcriptional regulator [Streptomyces sp. HUAS TT7]|uniref:winged helix-turn-helix domain-containing protein n=1 Tax=Streptomyces sp. HUAS TT7 TaxID=3447507 RepID=UPI003F65C984